MTDTSRATADLKEIQADARRQAINEMGRIIVEALRKAGVELPDNHPVVVRNPQRHRKINGAHRGTPRSNSGQARVLRIIQQFPGSRGFQIVVRSAETGRAINERTVRTALARLKKRGNIEMREDGGWYPIGGGER
jgi:hypothetical protein